MAEPKSLHILIKGLIVFSFIYEFACAVLVSKGIGGYFVTADQEHSMINIKLLFLSLLMIATIYMYLNYEKHNSKISESNDPRITVKSLRFPQIGMIIAMASITWLVH